MKIFFKFVLSLWFVLSPLFLFNFSYAEPLNCTWVTLNTDIPFVGRCIESSEKEKAFPRLMKWMTKMVMTLILTTWFLLIIAGWVMMTMWWADKAMFDKWKKLVIKVGIWIALLWASWIILHLINPNFFK